MSVRPSVSSRCFARWAQTRCARVTTPPAPELLALADSMGFLVMDEAFDVWARQKTPNDYHLLFPEWHEQDLRAMLRRDRNHPSVILWSIGNEVGEQMTGDTGVVIAKGLVDIVPEEDATRPITTAMNWSQPTQPLPAAVDVISLNYQAQESGPSRASTRIFARRFQTR
jgi:beta-galactosidase